MSVWGEGVCECVRGGLLCTHARRNITLLLVHLI